jgi:hypothetical protein
MVIRNWLTVFIVSVLLLVLFSGCLGVKAPSATPQTPPAIFVDYHRTGGVDGLEDRLVIFDNGAAVISRKTITREITLNQTDLVRLTGFFKLAQYTMLENNYSAVRGNANYIEYSISYEGKTVNTEDSAIPPALQPVIDDLNDILITSTGGTVEETPQFPTIPT